MTAPGRMASTASQGLIRLGLLGRHIVHGVCVVQWRFGTLTPEQRHARIASWSQAMLKTLRIEVRTQGSLFHGPKLIVANHVSWLDIVVLHSVCPEARFVSKAVVQRWPLIGRLVTGAGTLMVNRERRGDAARVVHVIAHALQQGDTVALFPEGTTSDGCQVLDFHSSLLQSAVVANAAVQPVALRYSEAGHELSPSVPYIGTTSLVQSLWRVCMARGLIVRIGVLDVYPAPHADRRRLSREVHNSIAAALRDMTE